MRLKSQRTALLPHSREPVPGSLHYNEKVRWALDYKRVPHRRVAPMPEIKGPSESAPPAAVSA
jgi:hypothetical protein